MIPGSNLFNLAATVIALQAVGYYKYLGRVENDVGQDVTSYAAPILIRGSFQPVPRNLYQVWGLDLQKNYYTLYAPNNLLDIARDVSGDQITFNNLRFQCESANDWFAIDGWKGVLCVQVLNGNTITTPFGFNELPPINENLNFDDATFASEDV